MVQLGNAVPPDQLDLLQPEVIRRTIERVTHDGQGDDPMELSRKDMMTAVADGIRQAIIELVANDQGSSLSLLDAVQCGVQDGIWTLATSATTTPCADFYAALGGVEAAMIKLKATERTES